jgi:rhamnose transport system substrate-binding protein
MFNPTRRAARARSGRRQLALAAILAATLTLGACGGDDGGDEAGGSAGGDKQLRLFMNPKFTGFPYFEVARAGGKKAADEGQDQFEYVGSDKADVSAQVSALRNALQQQPTALIVSAIDGNAVAPVLKQARERDVKVVTYDADAAADARDVFVNQLSYELAAKTMLDAALQNDPSGGKVAFVAASPTAPNHTAHIANMRKLIAEDPKYKVFQALPTVQYAADDEAKSFDIAVNLMQAEPDLKYIISSSAVSVPAAARAVVSQGKQGKVFATGFALPSAMKEYVSGGSVKAFALWDPEELGYVATVVAQQLAEGKITADEGTKVDAGEAGSYTIGKDGELQYNKPIIFTSQNIGDFDF